MGQEIPRYLFCSSVNIRGTHLAETFDMLGFIVLPQNLCRLRLAMLRRSRLLSHITRVCTTLTFSSAVAYFGRPDRPSSSTFSLPLLNSAAHFFHCTIRWRLLPKGFQIFFGGIPFLQKYLITALISSFSILQMRLILLS